MKKNNQSSIFDVRKKKIIRSKKAIEITMSTIVIALICLLVLAIVIGIFSGMMDKAKGSYFKQFDKVDKEGDKAFQNLNSGNSVSNTNSHGE